jgi:hypothetical protein
MTTGITVVIIKAVGMRITIGVIGIRIAIGITIATKITMTSESIVVERRDR